MLNILLKICQGRSLKQIDIIKGIDVFLNRVMVAALSRNGAMVLRFSLKADFRGAKERQGEKVMTFFNISNHPSSRWGETQKAAAGAAIVDVPFPQVPPEMGEEEVKTMAAATVDAISPAPQEGDMAMVSGEFIATVEIVREMQRRGVKCVVATTRRETVETVSPDGKAVKTATFTFVKWRAFPPMA